jgi:hypothetical protein
VKGENKYPLETILGDCRKDEKVGEELDSLKKVGRVLVKRENGEEENNRDEKDENEPASKALHHCL